MKRGNDKRPRRTIYGEAIKTLFDKFFQPLAVRSVEDDEEVIRGLRIIFAHKTREVYFAKAKRNFSMPGKTWKGERHGELDEGVGRRTVKNGDPMIVRTDITMPDRCEIEWNNKIFVMSQAQWTVIKEYVKPIG